MTAFANSCSSTSTPRFAIQLQTFDDVNGYGSPTLIENEAIDLDSDPSTWEQVSMCVAIPASTQWLLAEVLFNDVTLGNSPGFVDDVELTFDHPCCGPVPTEDRSWGAIKKIYK